LFGSSKAFQEGATQVRAFSIMPWCKTTVLFRRIGARFRLHLQSEFILTPPPPPFFSLNFKKTKTPFFFFPLIQKNKKQKKKKKIEYKKKIHN